MSRASLVLLVAIAVFYSTATSQEQCPENQEWTTCGSACPDSCNQSPRQPCTMQCVIGCQCKSGFLMNSDGHCVSPQNC